MTKQPTRMELHHDGWKPKSMLWSSWLWVLILFINWKQANCHEANSQAMKPPPPHQTQQQQQQQKEEASIDAQGHVTTTTISTMKMEDVTYGVDCSWPMHHDHVVGLHQNNEEENNPLNAEYRQAMYKQYMFGCISEYGIEACQDYEHDRIEMNRLQPPSQENYTHAGFAKLEIPTESWKLLQTIWKRMEQNYHTKYPHNVGNSTLELWPRGNSYVNHWQVPTHMWDLSKHCHEQDITNKIIKPIQQVIEAWTRQSVILTSIYGIRLYFKGSILSPHVDRLPLVSSAILNIAQGYDDDDVNDADNNSKEPWILEVIGHDGLAQNITMEPGDMVLYESHSIIHGRPYPLQANYYANIFVHFEPLGHTMRHNQRRDAYGSGDDVSIGEKVKHVYEQTFQKIKEKQQQQHKEPYHSTNENNKYNNHKLSSSSSTSSSSTPSVVVQAYSNPYYVLQENMGRWNQQFAFEKEEVISPKKSSLDLFGQFITIHHAAAEGMLQVIKEMALKDRSLLFKSDGNGWRPLHEAARSGQYEIVEYLLKEGAQVNERTNNGQGGNALWWAEQKSTPSAKHAKTIEILKTHGAVSLAPKESLIEEAAEKKKEKNL